MKLILKQVEPRIDVTSLSEAMTRTVTGRPPSDAKFALHTENGDLLPCQVSVSVSNEGPGPMRLTAVFVVDGENIRIKGHDL